LPSIPPTPLKEGGLQSFKVPLKEGGFRGIFEVEVLGKDFSDILLEDV